MDVGDVVVNRYELREPLGEGGMGRVYLAYDRRRQGDVALKTLIAVDAEHIFRLKQEFRALADLAHRNLVRLYDLHADGDRWFFTMERVAGVPFTHFVCRDGLPADDVTVAPCPPASAPGAAAGAGAAGVPRRRTPCDPAALRPVARQLAAGVAALHESGRLHRDLKPSNVLVEREGRVVILDLGLVALLASGPNGDSVVAEGLLGTPRYMAPEQVVEGTPLTAATDWYAVGAMLFESLTGWPPFHGGLREVLRAKVERAPPRPRDRVAGVPADLDELCVALLARDPEARPCGAEVLARLGGSSDDVAISLAAPGERRSTFVGRAAELARLGAALDRARSDGVPVGVLVRGRSGVGKTALVERFLADVARTRDAVVLAGRSFERESVPFKAVDGWVDALAAYLRGLDGDEARALLPRGIHALTHTFPVLDRVPAVAAAPELAGPVPDRQERRRRAFGALKELLGRLCDRRPLVVWMDDVQWGDVDSGALLSAVLSPPDAPALLWIASFRSEEEDASPLVATLVGSELVASPTAVETLTVEALPADDATELALALADPADPGGRDRAEAIAREAEGNPYLVAELAQHAARGAAAVAGASEVGPSLDAMLGRRLDDLAADARELLELVAVAGRPIAVATLLAAAGIPVGRTEVLEPLRLGRLARSTRIGKEASVEAYHDRVRETVVASLAPAALAGRHAALAMALAAVTDPDAALLAEHHAGAGAREEAGRWALVAADEAADALAFERAADLYRMALAHAPLDAVGRRVVLEHLGDALANAGRGIDAAAAYLEAVPGAAPDHARELERRAGDQLLRNGRAEQGYAVMRRVLDRLGMWMPRTTAGKLAGIVACRARLALRGRDHRERAAAACDTRDLARLDTARSLVVGTMNHYDPFLSAYFQARQLTLALDLGEPSRLCRALSAEAYFTSLAGVKTRARTEALLTQAEELARRLDDPYLTGLNLTVGGCAALYVGEWRRALERVARAVEVLREHCVGVAWETTSAQIAELGALIALGDGRRLSALVPQRLEEAEARGDAYGTTFFTLMRAYTRIVADDVAGARRAIADGMARWSTEGFTSPQLMALVVGANVDLYAEEGLTSHRLLESTERVVRRSMLLRSQFLRANYRIVWARAALQAAAHGHDPKPTLARAERLIRQLEAEHVPWVTPVARALRAGLVTQRGDPAAARDHLRAAVSGLAAADYRVFEHAARWHLGQLLGGDEGRALVDTSESALATSGFTHPARLAATCFPGVQPR